MKDDEPIAVGTRRPLGPARSTGTCMRCLCPVYFHDRLPSRIPRKMCLECFLASVEADEKFQLLVTPENIRALRELLGYDLTKH